MKQLRPELLCSIAHFRDVPGARGVEFCILGRSNVGKSSFISHALGRRGLARVSKTPGKTRVANFYRVDRTMTWVDMPGYGHARAGGDEKRRWSRLLRDYCEKRENLMGAIWLLDIRHPGLVIDSDEHRWLRSRGIAFFAVATKSDKLSAAKRTQNLARFTRELGLDTAPLPYSTMVPGCRSAFWKAFDTWRMKLSVAEGVK